MSSAFKCCIEESVDAFFCCRLIDETTGHHKNIRIIVLSRQFGNLGLPAECATDACMVIQRHINAVACTADCNTHLAFSLLDGVAENNMQVADNTALYNNKVSTPSANIAADNSAHYSAISNLDTLISQARADMERAAKSLDFMAAARYRDRMYELQQIKEEQLKSF